MNLPQVCLLSFALINAFVFTGCATVTRGTTETLMIQSTPSGADVRVSNGFTGRTPFTFTVPRKGDLIVTISLPGYEAQEHILHSSVAGKGAAGVAGNALIGGVIGIGVDMATGAALSHKPNPLVVTLKPMVIPVAEKAPPVPPETTAPGPDTPTASAAPPVAAKEEPAGGNAGASADSPGGGVAAPNKSE
ncbi:PEGA domain-containing protein [Oleiharenicola lentus]|jgi:hypothetical protein|uniref:PEGA domain-containing protein n=1 Tax=Oleiharenicola lentus TaxID=2508720 RepID=A0A4Q1C7V7_9BACT|nr:PEGA domain-containing protein [Oleiharenicola lentus]RXK55013.1 PEGA domain-containing protein [Oleiharenicola lentus]